MHISDVHDYSPPRTQIAQEVFSEARVKQVKGFIDSLIDDEYERLREYADESISQTAAARAERFLEKVLAGDEDAAMALIGDKHGGSRRRIFGSDEGKPWASLIHGRLFETGGIALRRSIVEAHPELLRNQRIADLESVVEGLTLQVRELTRDLENCRERLR
jgi:hypothetical protein